ncbi:MAG: hypothetical protein ACHQ4J_06020 [Candidatus Binatia bacterium]
MPLLLERQRQVNPGEGVARIPGQPVAEVTDGGIEVAASRSSTPVFTEISGMRYVLTR